ncbi:MAG: hypothetical protein Q6358_00785 [Candidatus Brocadiales bacterium]|nr:hypothetical protein [Candidatus Brocadiales bacterium]
MVGYEHPQTNALSLSREQVFCFLCAMECLERIAEATERFPRKHLYHFAAEARNIKKQIEKILTENL